MRQLGLGRAPAEVKPERQQMVLVSRAEVEAAMAKAGKCGPDGLGED